MKIKRENEKEMRAIATDVVSGAIKRVRENQALHE